MGNCHGEDFIGAGGGRIFWGSISLGTILWRVVVQGGLFGGNFPGDKSPGVISSGAGKRPGANLLREDFKGEFTRGSYPGSNCH